MIVKSYFPSNAEDWLMLKKRISEVHGGTVTKKLLDLNCPAKQKLQILDKLIKECKENVDITI